MVAVSMSEVDSYEAFGGDYGSDPICKISGLRYDDRVSTRTASLALWIRVNGIGDVLGRTIGVPPGERIVR